MLRPYPEESAINRRRPGLTIGIPSGGISFDRVVFRRVVHSCVSPKGANIEHEHTSSGDTVRHKGVWSAL